MFCKITSKQRIAQLLDYFVINKVRNNYLSWSSGFSSVKTRLM